MSEVLTWVWKLLVWTGLYDVFWQNRDQQWMQTVKTHFQDFITMYYVLSCCLFSDCCYGADANDWEANVRCVSSWNLKKARRRFLCPKWWYVWKPTQTTFYRSFVQIAIEIAIKHKCKQYYAWIPKKNQMFPQHWRQSQNSVWHDFSHKIMYGWWGTTNKTNHWFNFYKHNTRKRSSS